MKLHRPDTTSDGDDLESNSSYVSLAYSLSEIMEPMEELEFDETSATLSPSPDLRPIWFDEARKAVPDDDRLVTWNEGEEPTNPHAGLEAIFGRPNIPPKENPALRELVRVLVDETWEAEPSITRHAMTLYEQVRVLMGADDVHPRIGFDHVNDLLRILHDHNQTPDEYAMTYPQTTRAPIPEEGEALSEEQIRAIYDEYRVAERRFFLNLHGDDLQTLGYAFPERMPLLPGEAAAHFRQYGALFMMLAGLKPCVVFANSTGTGKEIYNRLVYSVLAPIMHKYQLDRYGFRLAYLPSAPKPWRPRPRRDWLSLEGMWVFMNMDSTDNDLLEELFVNYHSASRELCLFKLARAMGHPIGGPVEPEVMAVKYVEYIHDGETAMVKREVD